MMRCEECVNMCTYGNMGVCVCDHSSSSNNNNNRSSISIKASKKRKNWVRSPKR